MVLLEDKVDGIEGGSLVGKRKAGRKKQAVLKQIVTIQVKLR